MLYTTFLAGLAATLPITGAVPTPYSNNPTNFLLVTTTSRTPNTNSSLLPSVSATSLFDPFSQTNYLLRTIAPGYNSLPRFNLTSGTLESFATGPHGVGEFEYNSTAVRAGEELQFAPSTQPAGRLGLRDGVLLSVGGEARGWTICDGELEERVIEWKGNDTSCTPTYIQAVQNAPY